MSNAIVYGLMVAGAWIAVPEAPIVTEADRQAAQAAPGTSWFVAAVTNAGEVVSAKWTTTALGVYELYLNGSRVGSEDALKPGYTHVQKTRRSFTYDVTAAFRCAKGAENVLAAEVSAGWWRDRIVKYTGTNSAFRADLELTYADGAKATFGTDAERWTCAVGGPVKRAAIFDGEIYDARVAPPVRGDASFHAPVVSTEFAGEILPTDGAEICRRDDLTLAPVAAYAWKGVTGAASNVFGTVVKIVTFDPKGELRVMPGETLVVDFGQNCAAVPSFVFAAKRGVKLTCLPGEMLNDGNGEVSRGNDGPAGSLYRLNLRIPATGMRLEYTFGSDRTESYLPRHTFFGYRYVSITADGPVTIASLKSVPVTSVRREMELGRIETGDKAVNRLIANVYWGQLSNYLSVPTDCPQRNERLGWSADTQVFCEAGAFNADTRRFFRKWMRDMTDNRCAEGGFASVAPLGQYGNDTFNFGWADAGVIVPWTIWRQFGETEIVRANYDAMAKFVRRLDETKYDFEGKLKYIYADWLSFETFETCGNRFGSWKKWKDDPDARTYRRFLAACYWLYDARLMAEMAAALGKTDDSAWFAASGDRARAHIRATFFEPDGLLLESMRHLQTACVFALKFDLVAGAAREETLAILLKSLAEHDGCLQTGFLGTSFIMDALTASGRADVAYGLLLNHNHPSWLYSVDQGATTVWERWNSYTKEKGFGPVGMNSFNHYAYGAVLAWIYRTAAGIAADSSAPGFRTVVMAPVPDRRLGFVKAEYRSAAGLVKSAWRYEGAKWIWEFTVPAGATARVTAPGETVAKTYPAGAHRIEKTDL